MYLPPEFSFGKSGYIVDPLELMKEFNGWGREGKYDPNNDIAQYLWFIFRKESITEPELKVFQEKDFTYIEYQELKDLVLDEINKKQ